MADDHTDNGNNDDDDDDDNRKIKINNNCHISNKRQKKMENIWDETTNTLIWCGGKVEVKPVRNHGGNGNNDNDNNADDEKHIVKRVRIAEWVTIIKKNAFFSCEHLQYVEISSQVQHVEQFAFILCRQLRHVIFSKSSNLKSIGRYGFDSCERSARI